MGLDTKRSKHLTYNENIVSRSRELKLPSRIDSVDEAAKEAELFVKELGYGDDFASAIDLAVRESVANAIKHGNKLDETKFVEITFLEASDGFEITVRDFGEGFAPAEIPDPTDQANLLKATGRGILFMRSFMDGVEWFRHAGGGMVVKMTKRS